MAEYTIELRELISRGYKLALTDYPIFDENYRHYLNQKIIDHYYFREIGQETPDRFNFCLRRKMNEIMPYYNELYKTALLPFDPFVTELSETKSVLDKIIKNNRINSANENLNGNSDSRIASKSTDRISENSNVNQTTRDTTERTGQDTLTNNLKETNNDEQTTTNNLSENGTAKNTRTNDLEENNTTTNSSNRTRTATELNEFSDVPQTQRNVNTTQYPDGRIVTTGTDYVTTTDSKTATENENKTDNGTSNTTNTGTVTDNGTTTRTNTGTVTIENNRVKNNTGTAVTDKTDSIEENGTFNNASEREYNNTTNLDSEQNTIIKNNNQRTTIDVSDGNEQNKSSITQSGRKGYSPAVLLAEYRKTILNIDLMIINELEHLFMEVF